MVCDCSRCVVRSPAFGILLSSRLRIRTLLPMSRVVWCVVFVLAVTASLIADSNLRITDVGLHGYSSSTSAVRLIVRNPSSQAQTVHLRISTGDRDVVSYTVTTDVRLAADELRELELPLVGLFRGPRHRACHAEDSFHSNPARYYEGVAGSPQRPHITLGFRARMSHLASNLGNVSRPRTAWYAPR